MCTCCCHIMFLCAFCVRELIILYQIRFDTNQPPYRILFQREVNTSCLLIATADTESVIEDVWNWIVEKMIPQLDHIDDPYDREEWVASKIQHIVTTIGNSKLNMDFKIK